MLKPLAIGKHTLSFLEELNPAQAEAVRTIFGPLLVIAGAGSGKTKTLTCRMAYLVAQGVPPEKILLLTFTRRAAREMIQRASAILGFHCDRIMGGTFHSVSQYMLRFYGHLIGYHSNFTILDRSDAEDLINLLRNSLGLADKKRRFPSKSTLAAIYGKMVNQGKTLEEVLTKEYPKFLEFYSEIERLLAEYIRYKKEHQLMDYDDLLLNWLKVLRDFPQVREEIGKKFEFIMVDEYQDTNALQGEIVRYMAELHRNVMVVGDDSQSIYGFRGANYKNIFNFPKLFPEAKIIKLEQNYRSTQAILDVANAVISKAKLKYTKTLFTKKRYGQKPFLFYAKDESESSKFVADKVLELREKGIKLSQMAVLFRSAFHSFDLEVELAKRGIPFVKYGGLKLLESAHVKDFLAFLKVLVNPKDFLSWNRLLLLMEGIGPRTAEKIINFLRQSAFDPTTSLNHITSKYSYPELISFSKLFSSLIKDRPELSKVLEEVWSFYQPIFERIYYEDSSKRIKDIEGLMALSQKYKNLEEFLTDLVLEPVESFEEEVVERDEDFLILSTVHSAKGLEWHTVFIISLIDGRFPSSYSLKNEEELEEERRLFYVAVTRAREELYLIAPMTVYIPGEGKTIPKVSQFVREIPSELLTVVSDAASSQSSVQSTAGEVTTEKVSLGEYSPGDIVKHPHFGIGTVIETVGKEKVKVRFKTKGEKLLHLKYTKLEKIIQK